MILLSVAKVATDKENKKLIKIITKLLINLNSKNFLLTIERYPISHAAIPLSKKSFRGPNGSWKVVQKANVIDVAPAKIIFTTFLLLFIEINLEFIRLS